ncbi:aldose epimerase family protein [Caldalkalibacillus salinus]|uniref:aldose epimerase family protein n=1 Tax=Caldalkalibacillus salinus TaxID=2803787 RepID=UPI001921BDA6|nr:aldose epimerase family protein [Caldalkalibacillus salinus]
MKVDKRVFAEHDGQTVHAYTLHNDKGMQLTCIDYGCVITEWLAPDHQGHYENVVLGFDHIDDYEEHSPYFGAIIGRVAGRIKDASFDLEGRSYTLAQNDGQNHLHGGVKGWDRVLWKGEPFQTEQEVGVVFTYTSPDGEEGYPGQVEAKVTYTLHEDDALTIEYDAQPNQTTIINMTNHTYFNLSGDLQRDVLQHELMIKSDEFLELADDLIPTGAFIDVTNTPFDFRQGRKIVDGVKSQHPQNILAGRGYDHPMRLSVNNTEEIQLMDKQSGRKLVVETDQPSVVLYTGNMLDNQFKIRGVPSRKYLGLCLETQKLPDAIHHPEFESTVVKEGQRYRAKTTYTFSVVS